MGSIHEGNFKAHLATLNLAQLQAYRKAHELAPAQLAYINDQQLAEYNHVLDLIDEAVDQQQRKQLRLDYTGVVSIRNISHAQLLEKIRLFTDLVGRKPRITVCPHDKITFYVVQEITDAGLVIEIYKHSKTVVPPVDGVYNSVSLF